VGGGARAPPPHPHTPKPQTPIPNPQSPKNELNENIFISYFYILINS